MDATLYVTDDELALRLGVPRDTVRTLLEMYDRDPRCGFPKKQQLLGNRRYWPAVRHFFDRSNGLPQGG